MQSNNITYFDSLGLEHIPKEIKTFISHPLSSASQIKTLKQTFSEYKHMIQYCVGIFVSDLLILCLKDRP